MIPFIISFLFFKYLIYQKLQNKNGVFFQYEHIDLHSILLQQSTKEISKFQQLQLSQINQRYQQNPKPKKSNNKMGVPRFYKWLRARYPQIRLDLTDQHKPHPIIDNLYLDFNGIVYQCLSDSKCFLKNKLQPLTLLDIYQRVYEYMIIIFEQVNPQNLVFIAFDGVAPRSKINQSRDRRFRAILDLQKLSDLLKKLNIQDKQYFKVNSISPGTTFLTDLCSYLKTKIMALYENQWKHLKVFFSDCLTPGQGEHKIMDFLRQSKKLKLFDPTTTHCVYSADADVILLSTSLNIQNICILRQNSSKQQFTYIATTGVRRFRSPQFQFVFLNILKEYFIKQFAQCLQCLQSKQIQPIINDFILLMAFVGNDFLPVQFCFAIKNTHMQTLFQSYKQYLTKHKKCINNYGEIDWTGIQQLLEIAKKFEAQMIEQKIRNKKNLTTQHQIQNKYKLDQTKPSTQQYQNQKSQDDQIQNFQIQNNNIVKGKQIYYKTRFGIDNINNDPKFKDIIVKYIEGLQFYNKYYFQGVPSWTWNYPYHYPPLLTDVYQYIKTTKISTVKLSKGQPYDPFLALMFMLPQQSFHLLPQPLKLALLDPKCQLTTPINYYPKQYKLDKYQPTYIFKKPIIPFLPQPDVKKLYQSVDRSKYTDKQKQRNSKNNTIYFKFIGSKMTGAQIFFGYDQSQKDLIQYCSSKSTAISSSNKLKFPTLDIYGDFKIDSNGKIVVNRKYLFQGNPNQLVFFNGFIGFVQEMITTTQELQSQAQALYRRQMGIQGKCINLYKVKQAKPIRQFSRFSFIKTNNDVIVPDFALFKLPKWQYIPQISNFQIKNLYTINQRVAILNQKYFGYIGIIQQLKDTSAQIRLIQSSFQSNDKIQESEQQFYSLQYVSNELQLDPQVILTLLGQILIYPKTPNRNKLADIFPSSINMGLNIINRVKGLLLPHYTRCQMQHQNTQKIQQMFLKLQLSQKCKDILTEYIQKFQWLVDFIQESIKQQKYQFKKGISAKTIFYNQENPNFKLYQEFVKLYQFAINQTFYSVYSKVASKDLPQLNQTSKSKQVITLPYTEFLSKKLSRISLPPLKSQPQYHNVGDRVLLIKTFQVGYIVGVDDFKIVVLLPKRNNLICIHFLQAFNQKWINSLMKGQGKCWNLAVSYYCPVYFVKVKDIQ